MIQKPSERRTLLQSGALVTVLSGRLGNTFSAPRLRLARKVGNSTGRARGELAVLVDGAEGDRSVVDLEETVIGLAESDRLADQRLAQEQMLTAPLDLSVAAHPAHGLIVGIVRLTQSSAV